MYSQFLANDSMIIVHTDNQDVNYINTDEMDFKNNIFSQTK